MTRDECLNLLCEAMELPQGELTGGEIFGDLEQWDSLAVMNVIALLDERGGISLSAQQMMACKQVDELVGLVLGASSA